MNIEHFGFLSSVHEKPGTSQNKKPCARRREAGHKASASGDPAMVFGLRMASILSLRSRAPCPLRPAAGLLLGVRIGRDDFVSTPPAHDGLRETPMPE